MYGIDTACRNGLVVHVSFITQKKNVLCLIAYPFYVNKQAYIVVVSWRMTAYPVLYLCHTYFKKCFSSMFIVGLLIGKNDPAICSWSLLSQCFAITNFSFKYLFLIATTNISLCWQHLANDKLQPYWTTPSPRLTAPLLLFKQKIPRYNQCLVGLCKYSYSIYIHTLKLCHRGSLDTCVD